MLDLLHKDVVEETLETGKATNLQNNAAFVGSSKRFLTFTSFMTSITTLVRQNMDSVMEDKKYSTANASTEPNYTYRRITIRADHLPAG